MIKFKPVMPSSLLQERTDEDFNYKDRIAKNLSLKVGVVVDIIELEDKRNVSKVTTEYTVMTIEEHTNNVYGSCMSVDGFGGIADFFNQKLRKTPDAVKMNTKSVLSKQNGSIVLLLCIDGHSEQAVIIGSLAHPDRKNGKLTKDKGHHLEGEFNGVNWQIDKDGALTVTFKSATDNDAKPKDTKAGGSNLKIEKDGSIEVSDNNKENIRIDKTKKTISMNAESDISTTSDANINLTAKKNISAKATADLLVDAGGSFTAKSGGAFNIDSKGVFSINAPDVQIKGSNGVTIGASQVSIDSPLINLGSGGSPAVTNSTKFLGVGNAGAPVVCDAIGPFSSVVFIAP